MLKKSWNTAVSINADGTIVVDGLACAYKPVKTCYNIAVQTGFECSNCGRTISSGEMLKVKYCPECGRTVIGSKRG